MQLYALDTEKRLVFANHAERRHDYFCVECHGIVRLRGGPHRQNHYYHMSQSDSCRQSSKSMDHLQTQLRLYAMLPSGEVELEKRFSEIGRVADVVWTAKQLIFEIQCSPITSEELLLRNRDYASKGYQVVWIFHDKRFNQWRLSSAEQSVQNSPHYFTNIDADGNGDIYDQFDIIDSGLRKHALTPLPIQPEQPQNVSKPILKNDFSKKIKERIENWPLHFKGDLIDLNALQEKPEWAEEYMKNISEAEAQLEKPIPDSSLGRKMLWNLFVRPYRLLFQMLLERACK